MAQNIYDKPEFFAGYSRLPRSVHGLDGAPEWPAIRAMLPKLKGKRVVDLGCGFDWFTRWAGEQGAAQVLALDLSEQMIARAKSTTQAGSMRSPRTPNQADVERTAESTNDGGDTTAYNRPRAAA